MICFHFKYFSFFSYIPMNSKRLETFSNIQQLIANDDSSNGLNLDDALFTSRETCQNA